MADLDRWRQIAARVLTETTDVENEHLQITIPELFQIIAEAVAEEKAEIATLRQRLEIAHQDVRRLDWMQTYSGPDKLLQVWRTLLGVWLVNQGNGGDLEDFRDEQITNGHRTCRGAIDAAMSQQPAPAEGAR